MFCIPCTTIRRCLSIFLILTLTVTTVAQDLQLAFAGILLSENYSTFVKGLKKEGFEKKYRGKEGAVLRGEFLMDKQALVVVFPNEKTNAVSSVHAITNAGASWHEIESNFLTAVKYYRAKYGTPSSYSATFDGPMKGNDAARMLALQAGKCDFCAAWSLSDGTITVGLECTGGRFGGYKIHCVYSSYAGVLNDIWETLRKI